MFNEKSSLGEERRFIVVWKKWQVCFSPMVDDETNVWKALPSEIQWTKREMLPDQEKRPLPKHFHPSRHTLIERKRCFVWRQCHLCLWEIVFRKVGRLSSVSWSIWKIMWMSAVRLWNEIRFCRWNVFLTLTLTMSICEQQTDEEKFFPSMFKWFAETICTASDLFCVFLNQWTRWEDVFHQTNRLFDSIKQKTGEDLRCKSKFSNCFGMKCDSMKMHQTTNKIEDFSFKKKI